jgi:hypothetical protein
MEPSIAAPAGYRYPAFISYNHRDKTRAVWLRKRIEGYRVPKPLVGQVTRYGPIPRKLPRVFRDRDELAASADLSGAVRKGLAQSANLIVICSLAAVQSRWVNEEIAEFKRLGRADRILPLIVDGEPHAATPERECFPPALRFQVDAAGRLTDQPATEPIAADLRPGADSKEDAKLKLIAGLLDVGFDELRQRELIAARRRALIATSLAVCMAALAVIAAGGGVIAWLNAQYAGGLLAEATQISTDQVVNTVKVADQQRVSAKAVENLLDGTEKAFKGLYERIELAPRLPWRRAAIPASLRGQRALLLLARADHDGIVGKTKEQVATAGEARAELEKVVEEEPVQSRMASSAGKQP